MKLLKYKVLEWIWALKYFFISSPLVKRWKLARLIAHNEAVVAYRGVGLNPLPPPGAIVPVGDAQMKEVDQFLENQRKEVITEYE